MLVAPKEFRGKINHEAFELKKQTWRVWASCNVNPLVVSGFSHSGQGFT